MKLKIAWCLWCLFAVNSGIFAQNKISGRPNVIIINMDDMGYGDTEPYGMTGIPTPNFNKAAKEGMRFTHFNVAQAVCSPSRAALLTGCYPNRLGLHNALMPWSEIALNPAEETIPSLLKQSGYVTGMLGKWHLGSRPPFLPVHFGFDSFYGIPYSHDIWPVDYDGSPAKPGSPQSKYPPLPIYDGDKIVGYNLTLDDQAKLTGTFTSKAVEFIKANQAKPFFLYLAQPMPHVPLATSARFKGKSEVGLFGDVIMELDWSLGEIMRTLEKYRLTNNTLLIITSDNGPWLRFGDNAGSSGGLREGKGTAWDGGTRVPCIIRWPGRVEAGGVNSHLLTNMDLLPTIMHITKSPMPKNKIDGLDFADMLLGKSDIDVRKVFYYYYDVNSLKAVRYKNWKLVLPHTSQTYAALHGKDGAPGPAPSVNVKTALYDLAHDPGETYDVQILHPDIVQKIMSFVQEARTDLGDDLTHNEGKNRRQPGKPISDK
ncbi:sulfatase family protein [Mucilaginibacter boryungensis]|uniref:Sulfatase n=1 Tax=Mucilaginibacter boryungensis TaxID=768480 RepID=A0ABR9XEC6_9SPHI|nr:sulfatase [Mucilaginibacter boryungensis]MBE9665738.1 sulfatase [Mucilaginibacter boryungensis]